VVSLLTNSRDIKQRLEQDGFVLDRINGSHHIFIRPADGAVVVLPHPKRELGIGLIRKVYKSAGWPLRSKKGKGR
jgi:predicted RNA binding protein YcfA (HicA-like mRNA interferase family)